MYQRVIAGRRSVGVLLACLGLAGVLLASSSGGRAADPAAAVLTAARGHLGDRYVWGATGPESWDCSGFTSVLWRTVGGVRAIPRTAAQQQDWAVPIPLEQVRPGDLAFFGDPVTHVGIVSSRHGSDVVMYDASSSQHGVVQRHVWSGDVLRFGRVPRPGMPAVTPFRPAPLPRSATPAAVAQHLVAAPGVALAAAPGGARPLGGMPVRPPGPSSRAAARAVTLARGALGPTRMTDVEMVRSLWRRAGGAVLPTSRAGLTAAARPVPLRDARPGDLVIYPAPASHVGIYAGAGVMVDASRSLGRVVTRRVWNAPGVRLVRLPG